MIGFKQIEFLTKRASQPARWVPEKGAQTGDHGIGSAPVGSSLPTAIQDEDLMPSERPIPRRQHECPPGLISRMTVTME